MMTNTQTLLILNDILVDDNGAMRSVSVQPAENLRLAIREAIAALSLGEVVPLNELMARQRDLMNVLGVPNKLIGNPVLSPVYKDTLIMMAGEVSEALEPTTRDSKPWKEQDPTKRLAETTEELIDVLFFWMEAALQLGLTPEMIRDAYDAKREAILTARLGPNHG